MWVLALGGVFLATTQACILCQLSARDLSGRLAHVCSQVEAKWKDCGASWNFPAFALDEVSMNRVIEKTHRVLRVMALCAPACRGRTTLYNCSTCQSTQVRCWPKKRCFPGSHDLREARILLLSVLIAALLLGILSLVVESNYFKPKEDL
ncbi:sperm-egg fusion protein TMEM95 isoform X8 [Canis lupus baileyi]|uniref:sperm-egg fusion protein TMEM95 isoform X6 n=1 Tax=Canis lupus dingo TaxID=286419 RepID=UPI000BAA0A36|nr:sperm-egg fusion protein TMEM95 isoform X6 [Canis lupus dingo]|eukprot:XP_022274214.1 transmembrane protein 95 isoform X6 [Canis lupus familiaris]